MKVLRRSLRSADRDRSSHGPITPKSATAIIPPKKVIRALYDYEAQSQREISFQKGDFFHVIGRENDSDWYQACNPALPDACGLVPVSYFQSLGKTERDSTHQERLTLPVRLQKQESGSPEKPTPTTMSQPGTARSSNSMMNGHGTMVYGIVLYDFISERSDELDARAGEPIIVIAQSNPEWFVAKPIGRLGGPGLIPVSFIEIRDMITGEAVPDALEAVQRARVPNVEEWKRMTAEYKNSSISLGKFEVPSSQQQIENGIESTSPESRTYKETKTTSMTSASGQNLRESHTIKTTSILSTPISARIPRYFFDNEDYWFVVEVRYEDGRIWELSRCYDDFYNFQIQLLSEFPAEAGSTTPKDRTLPFMPGPVNNVTDAITDGRHNNLDAYVKNLLAQPAYISRCPLVKEFFNPRRGDSEILPNSLNRDFRLSGESLESYTDSAIDDSSRISSSGNQSEGNPSGLSAAPQRTQIAVAKASSAISAPSLQMSSTMKVKVYFGDDLIAMRVPADIQFEQLSEKIRERLKISTGETVTLSYKDDSISERPLLMSNDDLDLALSRNDKLAIYVE